MATKGQFNFSNGVIAPELRARIDVAGYYASLAGGKNCHVMRSGGVVNRAGTGLVEKVEFKEWVNDVEQAITDPAKKEIRLIPFLETEEESYVLEFTDSRIRVLRNGAYVKDKDGNTLEITNRDYLYNELAKIRYDQKNSFMTFVHRDNSPKQIELRSGVFTLLEYLQQSGAEGTVEQSSLRVWLPYQLSVIF